MKTLIQKYKHAWVFLYAFIYFPWFFYLEKHVTRGYHVIQTTIDKKIPFIEYFIIPYLLWFAFMTIATFYFFFTDKAGFYRMAAFLITGMTAFLILSTIYPNGQALRPTTFEHDNIFVDMVKQLYKTDTPTNVFPSIHVYNSIGIYIAIRKSERLKENKLIQYFSFTLAVLIILSTMFLKQHSVMDVIAAGILAVPVYYLAYEFDFKHVKTYKKVPTLN